MATATKRMNRLRHLTLALITACTAAFAQAATLDEAAAAQARGDHETAARVYGALAARGDAEAQLNLGLMHMAGRGVPQDIAQALQWFHRAAEQGSASAQFHLGVIHAQGRGVPRSDAQAAHWYRLAAEQGYARAQFNLGLMHEDGRGGPRNEQQAYFWWLLAAAQGNAEAARNRDRIEPQLTAQQRAAAQAQARDWRPGTALAQAPPPNRVQRLPPPPRAAAGFALRQGAS